MEHEAFDGEAIDTLVIQPSMILLGKPHIQQLQIPVDQLSSHHRLLYLRDFFPPNPAVTAVNKASSSYQNFVAPTESRQPSEEGSEEKIEIVGV
jgi:hypothetical protein